MRVPFYSTLPQRTDLSLDKCLTVELIRMVETTGPRHFGLDDSEVQARRRYVRDVRRELEVRLLYLHLS